MDKAMSFGLFLVLTMAITMTTSFVYPPPVTQSVPTTTLKEKDSSEESNGDDYGRSEDSSESVDDKEQMLCNVIVRVTHDPHMYQSKSVDEIIIYLNEDCKNLGTEELIEQCREIVAQYGTKIYEHVTNGMEMSQVCKKIEENNEIDFDDERTGECSHKGGNKCQCCKKHVEKRKMRLRYIVRQMAKKRMCMCKRSSRPHRCRRWIQRKEWHALKRIQKICPRAICKHLGYCKELAEDNVASQLQMKPEIGTLVDSPSLWLELLDQQLEAHFTKDICGEFNQLQALCNHLAASIDGSHYAKIYMAVLHNDTVWIDKSLREKIQSLQAGVNADLCDTCKNVIQSSIASYLQILETVRNTIDSTCEQSPVKEKCEEFFNKRLDMIKDYLNSLKPDIFCSAVHLCSSSLPNAVSSVNNDGECAMCVQHLQPRKDAAIQAIDRLSVYFTEACTKSSIPQCQQFMSEVMKRARSFIDQFNVQEMCLAMGLCGQNAVHDIDQYERAFVEEIGKQFCSTLGPFETLCQQVVQGDTKQVQSVSLSITNIDDFFEHCEGNAITSTVDQSSQNKDKCQCCIDRVIQKKKCLKIRVAKYIWHMRQLCKRSPAREKCEHYWEEKKACWDGKIDKICPKRACIHMGYCTKTEVSSMCTYMGYFKQVCEQALNTVGQLSTMLVNPAPAPSKDENAEQAPANKL